MEVTDKVVLQAVPVVLPLHQQAEILALRVRLVIMAVEAVPVIQIAQV